MHLVQPSDHLAPFPCIHHGDSLWAVVHLSLENGFFPWYHVAIGHEVVVLVDEVEMVFAFHNLFSHSNSCLSRALYVPNPGLEAAQTYFDPYHQHQQKQAYLYGLEDLQTSLQILNEEHQL